MDTLIFLIAIIVIVVAIIWYRNRPSSVNKTPSTGGGRGKNGEKEIEEGEHD